jgi:hypothetical protein
LQDSHRLVKPAELDQNDSQLGLRRCVLGPNLGGLLVMGEGLFKSALGQTGKTQAAPGVGVGWVRLQDLLVLLFRLGKLAGPVVL